MGKKEEITDVISEDGYAKLKVGQVLSFTEATLKITKKAKGRVWAEHVSTPVDVNTGMSHYGHNVDASEPGVPYCTDCERPIDQLATEEGEVSSLKHRTNRATRRKIIRKKNVVDIQEGEIVDERA